MQAWNVTPAPARDTISDGQPSNQSILVRAVKRP